MCTCVIYNLSRSSIQYSRGGCPFTPQFTQVLPLGLGQVFTFGKNLAPTCNVTSIIVDTLGGLHIYKSSIEITYTSLHIKNSVGTYTGILHLSYMIQKLLFY